MPWQDIIYGITENNFVMLGKNGYDYSSNSEVLELIKKYKKVLLNDIFNSPIDFLPYGVEELILGSKFNQPLANLPSSIKSIEFIGDGFYKKSTEFDQPIDLLPYGLEELKICITGKKTIIGSNLPPSLKRLEILDYCGDVNNIQINELPDSIEYLVLAARGFNFRSISRLPANLQTLKYYYESTDNNYRGQCTQITQIKTYLSNLYPQVNIMIDYYDY
jgi:FNIP Repeat